MSYVEYEKAEKLGQKAYRTAVQKGQHPYLPVLDEILSVVDIKGEVNLGLVQVPLDRVVGTSTLGRTYAFANNFMPILDAKSEFGSKWSTLCDAHMEEGIREPIKVYEYLNYYYVIEGNKRVSVLKYFDAVTVPAYVTRKVPKLTDNPEIRLYYEFMDFNKITGINFIWVSEEGGFRHILELTGTADKEAWDEDEIKDFTSVYHLFSGAYEDKGGKKLENLTTGDALIIFLEIYGYDAAKEMNYEDFKENIVKIFQEFSLKREESTVDISMDVPDVASKKSLLGHILNSEPTASKPLNIAFIYDKDPSVSDWLYGHELGRNHLKEVFGEKITSLKVTISDTGQEAVDAMEDLIQNEGTEVIFTTTSKLISASLKIAVKYPNVKVLNCSLNTSHKYIRTYYARLYEAKFLCGMIAGALTETNEIGYLADYPIFGVTANINAFALGAKLVNPRAKVHLRWTTLEDSMSREEIYQDFFGHQIDYISDQDMITPQNASRMFGIYKLTDGEPVNLAMPAYNWGVLYEKIIRIIINGGWKQTDSEAGKAINYWWGLSAGVIEFILSGKVPYSTARLVSLIKQQIVDETFSPFEGEIYDQNGELKNPDGERMQSEEIMKMDWLVDNVIGTIPVIDELEEEARPIVELKGVRKDEDENTGARG